jgi:hypothetical protein
MNTLANSGNSGVLLTDTHLYGKWVFNYPVRIALAAVESVALKEKWSSNELIVNGANVQGFSCPKRESLRVFTRML